MTGSVARRMASMRRPKYAKGTIKAAKFLLSATHFDVFAETDKASDAALKKGSKRRKGIDDADAMLTAVLERIRQLLVQAVDDGLLTFKNSERINMLDIVEILNDSRLSRIFPCLAPRL